MLAMMPDETGAPRSAWLLSLGGVAVGGVCGRTTAPGVCGGRWFALGLQEGRGFGYKSLVVTVAARDGQRWTSEMKHYKKNCRDDENQESHWDFCWHLPRLNVLE